MKNTTKTAARKVNTTKPSRKAAKATKKANSKTPRATKPSYWNICGASPASVARQLGGLNWPIDQIVKACRSALPQFARAGIIKAAKEGKEKTNLSISSLDKAGIAAVMSDSRTHVLIGVTRGNKKWKTVQIDAKAARALAHWLLAAVAKEGGDK